MIHAENERSFPISLRGVAYLDPLNLGESTAASLSSEECFRRASGRPVGGRKKQ